MRTGMAFTVRSHLTHFIRLRILVLPVVICAVVYIVTHTSYYNKLSHVNYVNYVESNASDVLFKVKPLVIWSNDYHISPINDLKNLLQPLGVKFIDKSLSGHCHITNTCHGHKTLKVINRDNAMYLDSSLIPKFYEAYKNDAEMQSVDAFVCFHPTSMCELFMPFNKSLLVIASTRYELGRFGRERWARWNDNLRTIAQTSDSNVVGGNNLYDVEYIRYFTGLNPQLLPSYCGYLSEVYQPTRAGFILAPIHNGGFATLFMSQYKAACSRANCTVDLFALRSKYSHYEYSDLVAHQGIVYVPYQVSVMSLFEQYRMNVPLFFPSVELLATWQHDHMVMNERTWDGVSGRRALKSAVEAHLSQKHIPDPNNDQNQDAIRYWIQFADFYQMPHITYFNSVDELVSKLGQMTPAELASTSQSMKLYNMKAKQELIDKWKSILRTIATHSSNQPH